MLILLQILDQLEWMVFKQFAEGLKLIELLKICTELYGNWETSSEQSENYKNTEHAPQGAKTMSDKNIQSQFPYNSVDIL